MTIASHQKFKQYLGSMNGFVHLSCDDHILNCQVKGYQALCDHLDIPLAPVKVALQLINPFSMPEISSNYADDINRLISCTELAWMLEEER